VRRLRDVIDPVGRRLGLGAAAQTGAIWSRWPHIVGADVAAHSRPTTLKDGVLVVRVDSPVWASEMTYLAPEMTRRVNDALNGSVVARIEIRAERVGDERSTGATEKKMSDARRGIVETGTGPPGRGMRTEASGDPLAALERARRAWGERRHRR
jgi:predicted nucleic acid-binding Zn ribbon protein